MINNKENPVEWALLQYELDEMKEHLEDLLKKMEKDQHIDEEEYRVRIGHLYAHLNRSWNSRNSTEKYNSENFQVLTKFPTDIETCG